MKEWEKELYILQARDYPHEEEPSFQSLVMLYLNTGDEKYFRWMLDVWEEKLNDIAMGAVQNYSMFGHFLDFKMTAVTGMFHALEQYDPTRGVPFEAFMRPYMKKEILAYELTKLVHGEDEAKKVLEAARSLFNGNGNDENMPSVELDGDSLPVMDLLVASGLCASKSEARRLIEQGGLSIDGNKIMDVNAIISYKEPIKVKKGKKTFLKIVSK